MYVYIYMYTYLSVYLTIYYCEDVPIFQNQRHIILLHLLQRWSQPPCQDQNEKMGNKHTVHYHPNGIKD